MIRQPVSIGFGFRGREDSSGGLATTSLVDILLSTIGVFVIIFALQEISDPIERAPLAIAGILVCRNDGSIVAYPPHGNPRDLALSNLAGAFERFAPEGGNFLIAVHGGCDQVKGPDGHTAFALLQRLAERFSRVVDEKGEAIHRFAFAPLGDAVDEAALLEKWREGAMEGRP